jgi:predicted aldo/keto reductase-like oxidoreductase
VEFPDGNKLAQTENRIRIGKEAGMAKHKLTRRQFLKNVGITCVFGDLLINPITSQTAFAKQGQIESTKKLPNMEYRVLGKTGLKVSALSFGVMRLTDPAVLFEALELGVNFFDTANKYQNGNNETMLGSVLKEYGRDKVFIATKIPPSRKRLGFSILRDPEEMQKMMDESLQRLKTDYVDVLFLHSIKDATWSSNENMMTFLEKQKKAGKARFVGISFHVEGNTYVDVIDQALETNFYDVFLATHNFKSPPEHIEALKRARSKQVGVIAMKTQAGGYEKGIRGNLTPHQAALKWVLDHDFVDCAIPGMVNREQLMQNMAVVGKEMSSNDREVLDAYYSSIKDHYCINCGSCNSFCKRGVDVQSVHRALMYREGYGDPDLARTTYRELSVDENAQACINCSSPTCNCINGINIGERMRHAHTVFV